MNNYIITNEWVTLEQVDAIIASGAKVSLSEDVKNEIQACRDYLDQKVQSNDDLIYGVNTGFGSLCNTAISKDDLEQLQRNLVLSHACGMGAEVPAEIIRRMLLLKALGLSHGNSGAQVATVERLLFFFNNDILPVVYEQGSLGASGDLSPLAHLSLPMLGEGQVRHMGTAYSAEEMQSLFKIDPIVLRSKEGLALLNGTQFMSAYA